MKCLGPLRHQMLLPSLLAASRSFLAALGDCLLARFGLPVVGGGSRAGSCPRRPQVLAVAWRWRFPWQPRRAFLRRPLVHSCRHGAHDGDVDKVEVSLLREGVVPGYGGSLSCSCSCSCFCWSSPTPRSRRVRESAVLLVFARRRGSWACPPGSGFGDQGVPRVANLGFLGHSRFCSRCGRSPLSECRARR